MTYKKQFGTLTLGIIMTTAVFAQAPNPASEEYRMNFDSVAEGQLPPGWKVEATDPSGPLAEWKVAKDAQAPSKPAVLTIARIHDDSDGVFNLCWTDKTSFKDGELEVKVRANSGRNDQGGGLIWRVKDANNYYIARYNPLENNFRVYYVKNGSRTLLKSAEKLTTAAAQWSQLKIAHRGEKIEGWFNGTLVWTITDKRFLEAGGVGLWSKSDAASSFDDFVVRSEKK